jgi:sporulation protein YlmC with PRC-barrel domain
MAQPTTRLQFIDYCKRRLGFPVIDINVDDDQISDRVDDALQFFEDYHFDGVEKMYMKHQITQADIDRRWIYAPDAVTYVVGMFPFDDSNASINMFDLRYQLRLHDLYDFTSVSYVSYEITMQHIRTLNLLFSGTPQIRFNRKQNKIFLDIDWSRDLSVGDYVIIDCYRAVRPATITLTGTGTAVTTANTITGTDTIFDQELLEGDVITLDGQELQVNQITSPTSLTTIGPVTTNVTNGVLTKPGNSEVFNDRFLKRYATALIKYQWGSNLSKFAGIQMPGGVTLDGVRIMTEAKEEMDKIEEDMYNFNSLPSEIFTG